MYGWHHTYQALKNASELRGMYTQDESAAMQVRPTL